MAATYTLATLRTAILRRVDHGDAGYFKTEWLDEEINNSAHKLHDLLIGVLGQTYALREFIGATTIGSSDYALPEDHYKLVIVQGLTDIGWVPLLRYELQDRVMRTQIGQGPSWLLRYHLMGMHGMPQRLKFDPPPDVQFNLRLTYHVKPPVYERDTDVIDIPWPEFILLDVAIKCEQRQRKDAAELIAERANLRFEIESAHAPDDRDNPPRVLNTRRRQVWPASYRYDPNLLADDNFEVAKIRGGDTLVPSVDGATPVVMLATEFNNSTSMRTADAGVFPQELSTSKIEITRTGYYLVSWQTAWQVHTATYKQVTPVFNDIEAPTPVHLRVTVGNGDRNMNKSTIVKIVDVPMRVGLQASQENGIAASLTVRCALAVMRLGDL